MKFVTWLTNSVFRKHAPSSVWGVVFLGILCPVLYDYIVKPGISKVSLWIFELVTLGSQSVKDSSYLNAALDPSTIPSLLLLLGGYGVVCGLMIGAMLARFAPRNRFRIYHRSSVGQYRFKQTRQNRKWNLLSAVNFAACIIAGFVIFVLHNESILIWRIHKANMEIIRPAITEREYLSLNAQFSSIKTENDYEKLASKLDEISKANHISLREEKPWKLR